MKRLLLLVALAAPILSAQGNTTVFNPLENMVRDRLAIERLRQQQQMIDQQTRLSEEHERNVRDVNERLEAVRVATQAEAQKPKNDNLDQIIATVRARHADFDQMRGEMSRLHTLISSGAIDPTDYLEALYAIAKYATFSQALKLPAVGDLLAAPPVPPGK